MCRKTKCRKRKGGIVMIKAEEARRIANGNSVEIRQRLEAIGKMVERAAREGRHQWISSPRYRIPDRYPRSWSS